MKTETWYLWRDGEHSPFLNMGYDEALLLNASELNKPILRFYGWDRPSISFGYVQKFASVKREGYTHVRRPTGGGVVFHDHDLTYTVVIPRNHRFCGVDRLTSYNLINNAVCGGLEACKLQAALSSDEISKSVDRNSMVCFQHPTRYDVIAADRKVAGAAQRRTRDGILHQGSINLEGVAELDRSSLTEAIIHAFTESLSVTFTPFTPSSFINKTAEKRAAETYCTPGWLNRR